MINRINSNIKVSIIKGLGVKKIGCENHGHARAQLRFIQRKMDRFYSKFYSIIS